jgi:hypothetical protein
VSGAGGVVHVTNGDAAIPDLRAAGVEGEILPWLDVLHDGPVPDVPEDELRRIRADFLGDGALARLEARDRVLASAERIVLWFEHDLYDQLQLVQVLATATAPAELVQTDTYLGDARLEGVEPAPVSERQRAAARAAWAALRAPDPRGLEGLEDGALPYLRPALRRLLEEFPSVANGLGRTEQQALEAVAAGASTRGEAFVASQAREQAIFMGDTTFFALLDRLEPLVGRHPELQVTPLGRQVLAGEADFVSSRWIGGVEIVSPSPAWRWHTADSGLVTMLAG